MLESIYNNFMIIGKRHTPTLYLFVDLFLLII